MGCARRRGQPQCAHAADRRTGQEGVRFEQARVTTSICMVSRATLLTGQYMSRHGITAFGRAIAPEAFANTYPGVLRRAGYWTGYVGKYGVGQPRQGDFDFLRAYEGTHWMAGAGGERIHVTEKNARDAIAFLQARPKDRSFALTVGFFAPHAEDNAPEQYLPQDWSAKLYDGVTIPPPLRGDPAYMAALPPFLSNEANEGRVRYHWRFDTPERYQAYMTRYTGSSPKSTRPSAASSASFRPRACTTRRSSSSSATTGISRPIAASPTSGTRTRSRSACRSSCATRGWRLRGEA